MALIGIRAFLLSTMYTSIVISVLAITSEVKDIESFEDLANNPGKKVYIKKANYQDDLIKSSPLYGKMKDQIIYLGGNEAEDKIHEMYQNVHLGTHIVLDFIFNINYDYQLRLQPDFTCQYPKERLGFSNLITTKSGWLYNKNFEYASEIDNILAWLEAYGLLMDKSTELMKIRKHQLKDGFHSASKFQTKCPYPGQKEKVNGCKNQMTKEFDYKLTLSDYDTTVLIYVIGHGIAVFTFSFEVAWRTLS